jgi:mannose-6-phosphate isomerase-like protein (cupin superfamily)
MSEPIHWTDDPAVWKGEFEGHRHGSAVSIIFAWLEPGKSGPKLHTHPYSETFVVRRGHAAFTAGDRRIEATAGDIVVVPPNTPHAFANAGATVLEMMDIHASEQIVTTWLQG